MLNLSDKELDRLAREAADEYEPGNQASPGAWDRMQRHLDKEMGRFRPNLLRSIRRIPFYFAPAVLLLVGVSYYLVRSARTPSSPARPPATRFPVAGSSSLGSSSGSSASGSSAAGSSATGSSAITKPAPAIAMTENSGSPPASGTGAVRPLQATGDQSIHNSKNIYSPTSTHYNKEISNGNKASGSSLGSPSESAAVPGSSSGLTSGSSPGSPLTSASSPGSLSAPGATAVTHTHNRPQRFTSSGRPTHPGSIVSSEHATSSEQLHPAAGALTQNNNHNIISPNKEPNTGLTAGNRAARDLRLSVVNAPSPTSQPAPLIDDAGLRKAGKRITTLLVARAAAEPVNPGKKPSPSMHIDRPLQLGFSLSPDFTSVNTLAADRPGSNIGVTADYQLLNRLHIHTGFFLSHKNYTAAQQDYHVPYNYYRMNNMHDVSFVKGTLNLFEIPLALRYDFSVAGNTVFFASGGVSSYLLTHENCNYYFDLFGRSTCQEFKYGAHNLSLFSTVDLSMGVETGLSNSLSFLIAPYMKLPTTGLGFGRVEMSSVGVEFALKYSPVLRRRRH